MIRVLLYDLLTIFLVPFYIIFSAIKQKESLARVRDKLFCFNINYKPCDVILHAVSVGEFQSVISLIDDLNKSLKVLVTNNTISSYKIINKNPNISHRFLPFDISFLINIFLNKTKPKLICLVDTEIWPNLIRLAHKKNIKVIILNGRISDKSYKNYKKLKFLFKNTFSKINFICSQSEIDSKRFNDLGVDKEKIQVLGNIKFDLKIPNDQLELGRSVKNNLFKNKIILSAISTHDGEEQIILDCFNELSKKYPNLVLCLVPRHPERFCLVFNLCKENKINVAKKSAIKSCDVLVGDTMGEIFFYLALSDIIFVGGSLVPTGGHNVVEPAALGLPIITGPYTHNFRKIIESFKANDAIFQLKEISELNNQIINLLENKELANKIGNNARTLVKKNSGAKERCLKIIHSMVDF